MPIFQRSTLTIPNAYQSVQVGTSMTNSYARNALRSVKHVQMQLLVSLVIQIVNILIFTITGVIPLNVQIPNSMINSKFARSATKIVFFVLVLQHIASPVLNQENLNYYRRTTPV